MKKYPYLKLLLALLAFDLLTKAAAWFLLPFGQGLDPNSPFCFYLSLNTRGLGSAAVQYLEQFPPEENPLLFTALLCFGITSILLLLAITKNLRFWPITVNIILFAIGLSALIPLSPLPPISEPTSVCLIRLSHLVLLPTIWTLSSDGIWKPGITFLTAGAIGNAINFLLPPFGVIDFIWSRYALSLLNLYIFNFADLYIPIANALLASAALISVLRAIRRRIWPTPAPEPITSEPPPSPDN